MVFSPTGLLKLFRNLFQEQLHPMGFIMGLVKLLVEVGDLCTRNFQLGSNCLHLLQPARLLLFQLLASMLVPDKTRQVMQPVHRLAGNAVSLGNPFPLKNSQHAKCLRMITQCSTEDGVFAM